MNHGWRGATRGGFLVNGETGEMLADREVEAMTPAERQRVRRVALEVQATHNLLLVWLSRPADQTDQALRTALQYALQRRGRRQPVLPAPLPGDGRRVWPPWRRGSIPRRSWSRGARTPGTALRLFADDGAGHRHRRARPRPHAQRAPDWSANYAQRSGRAGRQGQPGLIFTYCGAIASHDQYFDPAPGGVAGRGAGRAVRATGDCCRMPAAPGARSSRI